MHNMLYMVKVEPPHEKTNKMIFAPSEYSDQSLQCPPEESLDPKLPIKRTAKTLIRLCGCSGWSESSLGAHAILLVLSWGGSNLCRDLSEVSCYLCDSFLYWLGFIWCADYCSQQHINSGVTFVIMPQNVKKRVLFCHCYSEISKWRHCHIKSTSKTRTTKPFPSFVASPRLYHINKYCSTKWCVLHRLMHIKQYYNANFFMHHWNTFCWNYFCITSIYWYKIHVFLYASPIHN